MLRKYIVNGLILSALVGCAHSNENTPSLNSPVVKSTISTSPREHRGWSISTDNEQVQLDSWDWSIRDTNGGTPVRYEIVRLKTKSAEQIIEIDQADFEPRVRELPYLGFNEKDSAVIEVSSNQPIAFQTEKLIQALQKQYARELQRCRLSKHIEQIAARPPAVRGAVMLYRGQALPITTDSRMFVTLGIRFDVASRTIKGLVVSKENSSSTPADNLVGNVSTQDLIFGESVSALVGHPEFYYGCGSAYSQIMTGTSRWHEQFGYMESIDDKASLMLDADLDQYKPYSVIYDEQSETRSFNIQTFIEKQ